jgi:hypothetical protein
MTPVGGDGSLELGKQYEDESIAREVGRLDSGVA